MLHPLPALPPPPKVSFEPPPSSPDPPPLVDASPAPKPPPDPLAVPPPEPPPDAPLLPLPPELDAPPLDAPPSPVLPPLPQVCVDVSHVCPLVQSVLDRHATQLPDPVSHLGVAAEQSVSAMQPRHVPVVWSHVPMPGLVHCTFVLHATQSPKRGLPSSVLQVGVAPEQSVAAHGWHGRFLPLQSGRLVSWSMHCCRRCDQTFCT